LIGGVSTLIAEEFMDIEEEIKDPKLETSRDLERLQQRVYNHLDWAKTSADRQSAEDRWTDCQNFWLGKHWDGIKSFNISGRSAANKKLHPNPVDNYFKTHVEGLVGDICDRPADIQVSPREKGDDTMAEKMDAAVKYCWYRNSGDRKLEYATRRGVLHGPLIAKVFWNPDWKGSTANPFTGDAQFITVPAPNIFIDPRIKGIEEGVIQHAGFIVHAVRRSLAYIQENYPDKGFDVTADSYATYVDTLSGDIDDVDIYPEDQEVLLVEYWYKGEPLASEFPALEEATEPKEGWVHKVVVAGGILLEHRTYVYPWYPFVMEWIYPSDESVYGYGDGYDILMPQLVINKLNELSIEGADIQSQGTWLTEEGNVRNKAQFQKYARMGGSVQSVVDINRTRREPGGNVPSSLFTHYKQQTQAMESISGRTDVAQGRTSRRVEAASAIALLLQQSGGRVRQRSRALSSFTTQIITMLVDLIGQNYTEERLVRVTGADGTNSWQPVSRTDFIKQKTWTDPATGQVTKEDYIPEFDVIVTAGAETPTSRAYYSELAMQLFQAGIIDDIALLEVVQFPRWREALARKQQAILEQQKMEQQKIEQMQQMEQQMAQQQQQAPPVQQEGIPPELLAMIQSGQLQPVSEDQVPQEQPPQDNITALMQLLSQLEQQGQGGNG